MHWILIIARQASFSAALEGVAGDLKDLASLGGDVEFEVEGDASAHFEEPVISFNASADVESAPPALEEPMISISAAADVESAPAIDVVRQHSLIH